MKVAGCLDIEGVSNGCVEIPVVTMDLKRQKKSE